MARRTHVGKPPLKKGDAPIDDAGSGLAGTPPWVNRDWVAALTLVAAVFLVYLPVWHAGFIWDDDKHLTANPCIVGPLGLKEIWTTGEGQFFPLVLTTFWLEHALWGLQPVPYHVVNVLQHALSAVLLWQMLKHLRVPGAWLGAALWALHPIQAESVAWISELKNTQSCLFYLATILFYLKWLKAPDGGARRGIYALILLCAACAMASKSPTLVLPAVLALAAWWLEGRWNWKCVIPLVPIVLMSMAAAAMTLWHHPPNQPDMDTSQVAGTWPQRIASAGDVFWFYLGKLMWPYPLLTVYPRWQVDPASWSAYIGSALVVAGAIVLWMNRTTWARPYFFAASYYLVAIAPFLGLLYQTFWQYSPVQDHLQYLAGMGPLALAGAGLARLCSFLSAGKPWLPALVCSGVLLAVGTMSWQQATYYRNQETLWNHTLAFFPDCWVGQNNLGFALFKQDRVDEAVPHFQKALEIKPRYVIAHDNLGTALLQQGRLDEAMVQFQAAIELDPNYAESHNQLAVALARKGLYDRAVAEEKEALRLKANYVVAQQNMARIEAMQRQKAEHTPRASGSGAQR